MATKSTSWQDDEPRLLSKRSWRLRALLAALLITLLLYHNLYSTSGGRLWSYSILQSQDPLSSSPKEQATKAFSWDDVKPSSKLEFNPCYNGAECARLRVPLDYWNGTHPESSMVLAVARIPAKVPIADPRYAGPIIVNPGGPGGSGIGFVTGRGINIQTIVDSPGQPSDKASFDSEDKYFDILSFDPRGVGFTTVAVSCFENPMARNAWRSRVTIEGILGSSDAALGRLYQEDQALGASCATATEKDYDVKEYISTASVARDMVEIVERFGEWREAEAKRLQQQARGILDIENLKHRKGEEKVQYWGFSYGSFLGNTFASMFPDKVGRVIVDGVVCAEDYAQTLWTRNLEDTEKTVQAFYKYCAEAGPSGCALADENAKTPMEIEEKIQGLIMKHLHNPLPVPGPNPEIVTYSDLKHLIFLSLYSPLTLWAPAAALLDQISKGNGTEFINLYHLEASYCNNSPAPGSEAGMAILCGDGDPQTDKGLDFWDQHWRKLSVMSPSIGPMWAAHRMHCSGWDVRPKYRFTGPFGTNTSNPLLFIGNTADPVTPVGCAREMAARYPTARLLVQDSPGHCSISAFSPCTFGFVRAYMHNATLPPEGTVCPTDMRPFEAPGAAFTRLLNMDPGDYRMATAQMEIERAFAESAEWGFGRGLARTRLNM